ncbi:DNA-binding MarR family transcriptional regulator [Constrictibacter sp. MBR-5]|jgi:DNA-binding MarR family transcriptional regulator
MPYLPVGEPNRNEGTVLQAYLESISLIERLHRQFLDVVKAELDGLGIHDINNVQALILFNIGDEELTVGELTLRGYYLGSNVSYNLKKMVENGYIAQERSPHDRRSVRIRLSAKGVELWKRINEMFQRHAATLADEHADGKRIAEANETLKLMEQFWLRAAVSAPRQDARSFGAGLRAEGASYASAGG